MTIPDDRPPLPPERGDPARSLISTILVIPALVLIVIGSALTGQHHGGMPPAYCFALAVVLLVAAVAVLAGKGRQQ